MTQDRLPDAWPSGGHDPLLDEMQRKYLPDLENIDIKGLVNEQQLGRLAWLGALAPQGAAT